MTESDLEEFKKSLYNQQRKMQESNLTHGRIMSDYKTGRLTIPQISWHLNERDIDLSLQRDSLARGLLEGGITIIPNVDIEILFNKMTEADSTMFRKKELYNSSFNSRTISIILNHWLIGEKLIPPTIVIFNREYANSLQKDFITSPYLRPVDGKHRINAAYYFDCKVIPILVRNKQLKSIKKALGILS